MVQLDRCYLAKSPTFSAFAAVKLYFGISFAYMHEQELCGRMGGTDPITVTVHCMGNTGDP